MPGATANAFVPDPFSLAGERLYRTGDFVYWRDDGQLVFLGRRDRQVKVRGMRVELGEVEAQLRRTEGVLDVVVDLAEDGPAQGKLVGYVVARAGCALDAIELRAVLAEALPSYMIPSHIVLVEAIPFATTGKVDLSALRARLDESKPQQPPRGELSQVGRKLRDAIITPILGVASIGIDGDLFDLGVDSLQVLQIISAIETVFGMDIPVAAFFDGPSISDLAAVIEGMQASAQP
jgi:acyl carrier protein